MATTTISRVFSRFLGVGSCTLLGEIVSLAAAIQDQGQT